MGPVTTEGVILVDAPDEEVLGGVDAGVTGIRYITHIKCEVEYIFGSVAVHPLHNQQISVVLGQVQNLIPAVTCIRRVVRGIGSNQKLITIFSPAVNIRVW